MTEVVCSTGIIHRETGLDVRNSLLYAHMDLDSTDYSSPVMVRAGSGKVFLFVKDIERGNFDEEKIAAEVRFFKPYVTFDADVTPLPADWIELVKQVADGDLWVDGDFYTSGYWKLADAFKINLKNTCRWDRTYVYSVARDQALREFAAGNDIARQEAIRLSQGLSQGQELSSLLGDTLPDSRFDGLDRAMGEQGAGSLLLSSPLNVQEVSAIPYHYLRANETLALYSSRERIYILTRRALPFSFLALEAVYPTLASAAAALAADKKVGIEENHLPCKYCADFGLDRENTEQMSMPLRIWREIRAAWELPFYVIAAQATRFGMEQAFAWARAEIEDGAGITESAVQQHLYSGYRQFKLKNGLTEEIGPYFLVLHAGHRTRKPNLPGFMPLGGETRSLKIDSGVLVLDAKGLLRGASDLCRMLTLSPEATHFYKIAEENMLARAIPAAVPGRTGEEVYWAGVKDLIAREKDWVDMGLLPAGYNLAQNYNRNIGHSMGKQEPSALGFEKGSRYVVQQGMVCCVEYQWPYYPYAIGVEDMFVVTARGTVNITR